MGFGSTRYIVSQSSLLHLDNLNNLYIDLLLYKCGESMYVYIGYFSKCYIESFVKVNNLYPFLYAIRELTISYGVGQMHNSDKLKIMV